MTPFDFLTSYTGTSPHRCIKAAAAWVASRTGINPLTAWEVDNGPIAGDGDRAFDVSMAMRMCGFVKTEFPRHGDVALIRVAGLMSAGILDGATWVWAREDGGVSAAEDAHILRAWHV